MIDSIITLTITIALTLTLNINIIFAITTNGIITTSLQQYY